MEHWVKARSPHFTVLTDSNEKDATRLANQFERMHRVFQTLLPGGDDEQGAPIIVVAVKDRKGMQALEPKEYLAKNQMDLAGFFLRAADKNYILVRLDAQQAHAYSTVYHEYTHYMLRKDDRWLPLWLNEGLAQFYENTDVDEKTVWLGEASAQELQFLKRNDLLPIETLFKVDTRSPYYHDEDKGSIFYAESWALTHYLISSDRIQGLHRMHDYTELLVRGEDPVTAARMAFGDLDKLQQGLSDYVMQRKFMYFMMQAQLAPEDGVVDVRPVTASDADAIRADMMVYTGRAEDARELTEQVLAADPANALAHETMGMLRLRAGDLSGAKRWYKEAALLNPDSSSAQYYSAMLAFRTGSKGEDEAIESGLKAAIRLNGDLAPAYDVLATFYLTRHRNFDEAQKLSLKAIELEPARLSYRLDCADIFAREKQFSDARSLLEEAMRLAKTPAEIEAVASRLNRVELEETASASIPSTQSADRFGQ